MRSRLVVALILLSATGCARAQRPDLDDVPPGLTARPGIYADVNPRWSPDGRQIAFLRSTPDRNLQLYVVDPQLVRPLALLEAELVCPDRAYSPSRRRYVSPDTLSWSPDGRFIAFERVEWFTFDDGQRLPGTGLWTLDMVSGRVAPLALHPKRYERAYYYYHTPQWSPDGRYVAFVGEGINGQRSLFVHPLAGQSPQAVVPRFDTYADSDWPAWQPHGARRPRVGETLAFRQGILRSPWVAQTETLRQLCPGCAAPGSAGELWRAAPARRSSETVIFRSGHLVWSPDGERLAFTVTPNALDFTRYEIWTIRRDGTEAHRVSPPDRRGYVGPVWIGNEALGALSPRGDRFDVVTLNCATRAIRALGEIDSADCDWSPDRSRIVYAAPQTEGSPSSDRSTTLRLFETGISSLRWTGAASCCREHRS